MLKDGVHVLTTDALTNSSNYALENVFGVHPGPVEALVEERPTLPGGTRFVASIHFTGDDCGQLLLAMSPEDSMAAIELVLHKYAIEIPIKEFVVYAELMNIFAANLTSKLIQHGLRLMITTPDTEPALDDAIEAPRALTLRIGTDEGLMFVVCYYSSTRK